MFVNFMNQVGVEQWPSRGIDCHEEFQYAVVINENKNGDTEKVLKKVFYSRPDLVAKREANDDNDELIRKRNETKKRKLELMQAMEDGESDAVPAENDDD